MDKGNIFLIGFMGAGKSTIARMLSKEWNASLIEMDETIEKEEQMSIPKIFETYGEEHFRDLERRLIQRITKEGGAVVSCGGGAVLREDNVRTMKENGRIVYLSATPETIYHRVRYSTNRPLLNGNMNVEFISELMERRRAVYESAADIEIITDGLEKKQIVERIKAEV